MMMKLWIVALIACLLPSVAVAQTGSAKTQAALNTEIAASLASGQTPPISASTLRQVLVDMVASTSVATGTTGQAGYYAAGGTQISGSTGLLFDGSSHVTNMSFLNSGSGSIPNPGIPPLFAFSNESFNAGAGTFYEPFVFQENTNCLGASCGERNTMVVEGATFNAQAGQFYNAFQANAYAFSGSGLFSASNPYVLICNAGGTDACTGATGVSATADAVGEEINTDVRIATINRKVALQLVSTSTDIGVSSNTNLDGAMLIANQSGGVGFRNGIIFGNTDPGDVGVYGSFLFAPVGPAAPTNYINFPNMVVTGGGAMSLVSDILAANVAAQAGGNHQWFGRSLMWSPSNGVIVLTNNANNDFTRLQLGGITNAFPSIKRNGTALNFRLADDSADAAITSSTLTLSPPTTSNAITIAQNPSNHAGVINFLDSLSASASNVTAVDNSITMTTGVTSLQLLNAPPAVIPTTTNLVQLGGAFNMFTSVWSKAYSVGGTTPTPTGTCTAPTMAGGNTAGTITTGTGCLNTQTIILTFALTATTGWACNTVNRTAVGRPINQSATSATTATFLTPATATNNGDIIQYSCMAY